MTPGVAGRLRQASSVLAHGCQWRVLTLLPFCNLADARLRIASVLIWTQHLQLLWRPELRFYEQRTELLRRLERADLLDAFRWTDQSIGARVGEHADIEVSSRSATLRILSPRTVVRDVRQSLELTVKTIEPAEVTLNKLRLAVVVPLDRDFTQTTACTGGVVEPALEPEALPVDWSVLLDGQSTTTGFSFQVEYGVIRHEEAAPRLEMKYARIPVISGQPILPGLLDDVDLPDCAFFLDWSWDVRSPLEDDLAASLAGTWDMVVQETRTLSRKLQSRLGLVEAILEKEA